MIGTAKPRYSSRVAPLILALVSTHNFTSCVKVRLGIAVKLFRPFSLRRLAGRSFGVERPLTGK